MNDQCRHWWVYRAAWVTVAVSAILAMVGCGATEHRSPVMVTVGTSSITKAAFEKRLAANVASYAHTRRATTEVFFDPPAFRACSIDERRSSAGGAQASRIELRRRCRARYDAFKRNTLDSMIEVEWLKRAASRAHIHASSRQELAAVRATLERRAFDANEGADEAAIAEYYRAHQRNLVEPERRDSLMLLTDTEQDASDARQRILHGVSWQRAANQYAAGKDVGRLNDQTSTSLDEPLRSAIFDGREGDVSKPLETFAGWYIVSVVRVHPAFQLTLRQSSASIKDFLDSNRRRYAHYAYQARFERDSRAATRCVGSLIVPNCSNGPTRVANRPASHEDALNRPLLPVVREPSASRSTSEPNELGRN